MTAASLAWVRRHRSTAVLVSVVLAAVVLLSVLTVRSATRAANLDPDNPSPNGAQAVARVLADHGVEVTVVRRAAGLASAAIDGDTTLLVTSSENLGRATARQVDVRAVAAGALVLAAPGATPIRVLDLPLGPEPARTTDRTEAGCDDPLMSGLAVDVGPSLGYRGTGGSDVVTCFRGRGPDPVALVVRVDQTVPTYAVGGTDLLTNDRVTRADNAAVALRLLGQHDRLVWYVPDRRDVPAGDAGSVRAQLPRGLFPTIFLVFAATLATMVWRGRRLGALVTEPLPVAVKAVQSTQGRGRLYRKVRDRSHAAAILREATLRRLTTDLRLPAAATTHTLVTASSAASGRAVEDVHDLLVSRPVPDDAALTRLAEDLTMLEREVHHP